MMKDPLSVQFIMNKIQQNRVADPGNQAIMSASRESQSLGIAINTGDFPDVCGRPLIVLR